MKNILSSVILICLVTVFCCSGEKHIYIDTKGMKVKTGELKAYELLDGKKGKLLSSTHVDQNVSQLTIADSGKSFLVELTDASFEDFTTGEIIGFEKDEKWATIITPDEISSLQIPFQINPLTTLGVAFATYRINYALDQNDSISKSKMIIEDHFKTNLDSTPLIYGEGETASIDSLKYYLAIAGLFQLSKIINEQNSRLIKFNKIGINQIVKILVEDIAFEGIANGISSNGRLSFGYYYFSEDTLKSDLVLAIRKFMSENQIEEKAELTHFLENILRNNSELFVPANNADLDNPQIRLLNPPEGTFVKGTFTVSLEATDKNDISLIEVKIKPPLDNKRLEIQNKSYLKDMFEGEIDTTEYLEGPLLVIAKATDRSGLVTEKIFVLFIDKFPPQFTANIHDGSVLKDSFEIIINAQDSGSMIKEIGIKESGNYHKAALDHETGFFKITLDTNIMTEGRRSLTVKVTDEADNEAQESYDVLINNNIINFDNFVEFNGILIDKSAYDVEYAGFLDDNNIPDLISSRNVLLNNVLVMLGNSQFNYLPENSFNIASSPAIAVSKVSISANCDINNDGHPDSVVGAPSDSVFYGRTYAFFGPLNSLNQWSNIISLSNFSIVPSGFGASVECLDVNKDGYDDIITVSENLGARYSYIYFGPDLSQSQTIKFQGEDFSGEVNKAGDVNGDGIQDFIIDNKLIYGSAYNLFSLAINLPEFTSISSIGDFDKDGDDDLLIGKTDVLNKNGMGHGIIQILHGGQNFPSPGQIILPPVYCENFGHSVSSGDIDGDGFIDLIASSPRNTIGDYKGAGEVFVFLGPNFNKFKKLRSFIAKSKGGNFGERVKSGFDINLDGRDDLIVLEPGSDDYPSYVGSFHVMFDTE